MDPIELLRYAQDALKQGATPEQVDEAIRGMTNGAVPNMRALAAAVESVRLKQESETAMRASEHGAVSNFFRMLAQGATFGLADEIVGALGGDAEKSRQRVEDLRSAAPGASLASELAGGMLVPGAAARGGMAAGGALRAAGTGAAAGAAGGGLWGFGEGEGGFTQRMQNALPSAAAGAVTGGVLGPAVQGAARLIPRVRAGAGARVARDLEQRTGISRDINAAYRAAREGINDVRDRLYKPLQEEFRKIEHEGIANVIGEVRDLPASVRNALPKEVLKGERAPSFTEMQSLKQRLSGQRTAARRKGYPDLVEKFDAVAEHLDAAMKDAVPGYAEAGQKYAQALGQRRALELGRKASNWSSAEIERALESLPPEAHNGFNQGRLFEIVRKLEKRDRGSVGLLQDYLNAGPETRRVMRSLFPNEKNFEDFQKVLRTERSAERVASALKRLAVGAIGVLGLEKIGIIDIMPWN